MSKIPGLDLVPGVSPVLKVLSGACSLASSTLNPDTALSDLTKAKNELKEDVKAAFSAVASEMSLVQTSLSNLRDEIEELVQMISESRG